MITHNGHVISDLIHFSYVTMDLILGLFQKFSSAGFFLHKITKVYTYTY